VTEKKRQGGSEEAAAADVPLALMVLLVLFGFDFEALEGPV